MWLLDVERDMSDTSEKPDDDDGIGCLLIVFIIALFIGIWVVAGAGWAFIAVAIISGLLYVLVVLSRIDSRRGA